MLADYMNKKHFLVLLIISLAIIAYPIFIGVMNYTGFCWGQKRFLSDDEKIRTAIIAVNDQKTITITSYKSEAVEFKNLEYVPYKSVNDFLHDNPSCCRVLYSPYKDSVSPRKFMDSVWGLAGGSVEVTFNAHYKEGADLKSVSQTRYVGISNCGKTH